MASFIVSLNVLCLCKDIQLYCANDWCCKRKIYDNCIDQSVMTVSPFQLYLPA